MSIELHRSKRIRLKKANSQLNTIIKNDIKNAFLFCCFCGLRHSDVVKLTWGEIVTAPDGSTMIQTQMKKTKKLMTKKSHLVFPNLPDQPGNADVRLKVIIKKAVNLIPML